MPVPDSPEDKEKIGRLREAMYSRTLADKLKARDRRSLDETREIVGDDFVKKEGSLAPSMVAPRNLSIVRRTLTWILIAAVIFFLAAMGFFAYYFTFGSGAATASPSNIDITVAGPPQIQSGGVTQFEVAVTNRNNVPLELADLVVTFPSGTRSSSDFTTDEPTLRETLGTIAPGETRQGEISAVLSGVAGQGSDVKVELEYRLSGSSAIFVASTDYSIVFGTSPLSISVAGNSQTISGQPIELDVTVTSNAPAPISDVLFSAAYPFGFTLSSAIPSPLSAGRWNLGEIDAGASKTITILGTEVGNPGDSRSFQFTAGTSNATSSKTISTTLSSETYAVAIAQSFLGLHLTVNNASTSVTVSPGESVAVSINYTNNLPDPIENAVIVAALSGTQIDGSTIVSQDGFFRSGDNSMIWDKTTESALGEIAPGESGVLKFTFTAPSGGTLDNGNPHIVISLSAAGQRVSESGVPQNLQAAVSQTIGIASDLDLAAQGLYYGNPFGSSGPIPPKADTETTYGLVLTVTNTTSDITDAAIEGSLPPSVRYLQRWFPASATLYFRGDGRDIPAGDPCQGYTEDFCWSIGEIKPGTGFDGQSALQGGIAIGFTPSDSQIGSQPAILQNVKLLGIDSAKEAAFEAAHPGQKGAQSVLKTIPDITTNLIKISETSGGMPVYPDTGFVSTDATVVSGK